MRRRNACGSGASRVNSDAGTRTSSGGGRSVGVCVLIGIVIVAHGGLANEYLAAVEHVIGQQPGIVAIPIEPEHDRHAKQAEICDAADRVDRGDGVVVVTDMFGGSPSNLSLLASAGRDRRILYGANLPLLIKLAKSRGMPVAEATAHALEAGRKYIDCFDGVGSE